MLCELLGSGFRKRDPFATRLRLGRWRQNRKSHQEWESGSREFPAHPATFITRLCCVQVLSGRKVLLAKAVERLKCTGVLDVPERPAVARRSAL